MTNNEFKSNGLIILCVIVIIVAVALWLNEIHEKSHKDKYEETR